MNEDASRRPGYYIPVLVTIILVALALSFPGILHPTGTSAPWVIRDALRWIYQTTLHSTFHAYPTLYANSLSATVAAWWAVMTTLGPWSLAEGLAAFADWRIFLPLGGYLSMFYGAVGIAATAWLGRQTSGNHSTGVLAATMIAFTPTFNRYCHEGVPDCLTTTLSIFAMIFIVAVLRRPTRRNYLLTGLFVGLAIAAKWNAVLLAVVAVVAHVWIWKQSEQPLRRLIDRNLGVATVAGVAAFCVGSIQTVADPRPFLHSVLVYERDYKMLAYSSAVSGETFVPFLSHIEVIFAREGWVSLLFPVGIIWAFIRRKQWHLILLLPVLMAFIYIGRWRMVIPRFYLFVYPFAAVLAADCFAETIRAMWRRRRLSWRVGASFVAAGMLVCVGHSTWRVAETASHLTLPNTEELSREWIESNIERGAVIAGPSTPEGYPNLLPQAQVNEIVLTADIIGADIRPEVREVVSEWKVYDLRSLKLRGKPLFPQDWPSEVLERYRESIHARRAAATYYSLDELRDDGVEYVVTSELWSTPFLEYESAAELPGYDPSALRYDQNRAFFEHLLNIPEGETRDGVTLLAAFESREGHVTGGTIKVFRIAASNNSP